jgi:hypothetical protein
VALGVEHGDALNKENLESCLSEQSYLILPRALEEENLDGC